MAIAAKIQYARDARYDQLQHFRGVNVRTHQARAHVLPVDREHRGFPGRVVPVQRPLPDAGLPGDGVVQRGVAGGGQRLAAAASGQASAFTIERPAEVDVGDIVRPTTQG